MITRAAGRAKLTIAHRKVYGEGYSNDEKQRDKIRRYDRHAPIHQAQNTDHRHARNSAAGKRQRHPTQFAEDQPQRKNNKSEYAKAKARKIASHKGNEVIGNHRRAAEVDLRFAAVVVEQVADLCNRGGLPRAGHYRVSRILLLNRPQLSKIICIQNA